MKEEQIETMAMSLIASSHQATVTIEDFGSFLSIVDKKTYLLLAEDKKEIMPFIKLKTKLIEFLKEKNGNISVEKVDEI